VELLLDQVVQVLQLGVGAKVDALGDDLREQELARQLLLEVEQLKVVVGALLVGLEKVSHAVRVVLDGRRKRRDEHEGLDQVGFRGLVGLGTVEFEQRVRVEEGLVEGEEDLGELLIVLKVVVLGALLLGSSQDGLDVLSELDGSLPEFLTNQAVEELKAELEERVLGLEGDHGGLLSPVVVTRGVGHNGPVHGLVVVTLDDLVQLPHARLAVVLQEHVEGISGKVLVELVVLGGGTANVEDVLVAGPEEVDPAGDVLALVLLLDALGRDGLEQEVLRTLVVDAAAGRKTRLCLSLGLLAGSLQLGLGLFDEGAHDSLERCRVEGGQLGIGLGTKE